MSTQNIKVLHIRSSGAFLGAERVVLELAQHAQQYGVESIVGVPVLSTDQTPELVTQAQKDHIPLIVFNYRSKFSLMLAREIKDYVEREGIHLVHSHGYQENFYAWLAKLDVPLVATNHLWKKTDFKLWCYAKLDAAILKSFNKIIAVSKPIHAELISAGIKKDKIQLISNGVDIQRYSPHNDSEYLLKLKQSLGIAPQTLVLGMVSSLTHEKGHIYAIEAFDKVIKQTNTPVVLLIIGEGENEEAIRKKINSLGISSKVLLAGRRMDIPDILSMIDIYILSSLIEGLPMSLLEAMACRLPVIASDVGDIGAVIQNEVNGYLVSPKNADAISSKMLELIEQPVTRAKMAEAAQITINNNFSSSQMALAYCNVYREVLGQ